MTNQPLGADAGDDPPTQPIVSSTVGDRCVSCGTPMSSDQRYCVACGERRGQPRFGLLAGGADAGRPSAPTVTATALQPAARPGRASSGTTVVAGVGTLLLAMGVGVLIGRDSTNNVNNRPVQAAAPTVIHVAGGPGTATTAASSSSGTSHKKTSKSGAHSKSKAAPAARPTAAQAAKASNAASKVLGAGSQNLPPATVTVGQTGHGPGYNKTGKFDGSFFGH